jgi:hypothetical protein
MPWGRLPPRAQGCCLVAGLAAAALRFGGDAPLASAGLLLVAATAGLPSLCFGVPFDPVLPGCPRLRLAECGLL